MSSRAEEFASSHVTIRAYTESDIFFQPMNYICNPELFFEESVDIKLVNY